MTAHGERRVVSTPAQVVNLGERAYTYENPLHVLPLDRLWA